MPRATRVPLTRAEIIAVGIDLADREGIDAVSMRRVADALTVVPMALYRHVADKEDLVDGMVDALIADFDTPRERDSRTPEEVALPPHHWRAEVRDAALAARAVVNAHPWARRALETRTLRTPAVLGHMERLTAILLAGGLSPDLTHHAMHALGNRIWGFSPELFNDPGIGPSRRSSTAPQPDPADYPAIGIIAAEARKRRPKASGCHEDFEFVFALDLILDAVQRLHESRWSSPR